MAEEQLKYTDFEELVFENRNKAYGAYDMRRSYKGILTKAFLIGVLFFSGITLLLLMYFKTIKTETKEDKETIVDLKVLEIPGEEDAPKDDEPLEQKQEQALQSLDDVAPITEQIATVAHVVPEPVENPPVEQPAASKSQMQNSNISTETQAGASATNNAPPPVQGVAGGTGSQAKLPGTNVVDGPADPPNKIHTSVDVEADYGNGGLNGFRAKVHENFDTEAVEGEGILTTTVKFVVETNGTVSQVKATGSNADFNREAERVVRSIKGWKPAKKGGVNVRSYYSLPLKMQFQ